MAVNGTDRDVLRRLAAQVAEIAALPVQQEKIGLWKASNGLKPVRPMVMIDQICWHEMDVDDELTLQCADPFCRRLETRAAADAVSLEAHAGRHGGDAVGSTSPRSSATPASASQRARSGRCSIRRTTSSATTTSTRSRPTRTSRRSARRRWTWTRPATAQRARSRPMRSSTASWRCGCRGCPAVVAGVGHHRAVARRRGTLWDLADRPEFMHRLIEPPDGCGHGHARPAGGQGPARLAIRAGSTAPGPGPTSCPAAASTPPSRGRRTSGRSAWRRSSPRSRRPCTRSSRSPT